MLIDREYSVETALTRVQNEILDIVDGGGEEPEILQPHTGPATERDYLINYFLVWRHRIRSAHSLTQPPLTTLLRLALATTANDFAGYRVVGQSRNGNASSDHGHTRRDL